MTTSISTEVEDKVPKPDADISEPEKPRDINELLDLPYSEMTDEEIERVIQFKADVQTRDALFAAQNNAISEALTQAAAMHMDIANNAQARLNELTAHAIARYEKESANEQAQ